MAANHTFPTTGRRSYLHILDDAGYVEYSEFVGYENNGYFCHTCTKLDDKLVQSNEPNGFVGYYCRGLEVPVAAHGCCNYWVYLPPSKRG